jgi:putative redox protein
MALSKQTSPPAEDWREIHATWQGGNSFLGLSSKGNQISMGAISDPGASPMELVLIALAGCTGMDIVGILEKKRKNINKFELTVRGLRRFEKPRIYTDIQVLYELWSDDLDEASLEQAIQLSEEKYCSVSGMLGEAARISSTYTIHKAGDDVKSTPAGIQSTN